MSPQSIYAVRGWVAQKGTIAVIVLQEYPQHTPGVRDYRILAKTADKDHTMFMRECAWEGADAPEWWQVVKHAFGQLKDPSP